MPKPQTTITHNTHKTHRKQILSVFVGNIISKQRYYKFPLAKIK